MNILTSIKTKSKQAVKAIVGSALALGAAVTIGSTPAHAGVSDMFSAVDVSGLGTNIETMLVFFIGLMMLGVGYKYLKRAVRQSLRRSAGLD